MGFSGALTCLAASLLALCAPGCHDKPSNQTDPGSAVEAQKLSEIRLDYATYNLSSLVLKHQGWLEQDLARDGIAVRWVFSQGSNKANELIASDSVDLASTAGAAALLARTNGVPLKVVYVYAKSEWSALVVGANSPIMQLADLKGKKVAATRGTDPFFFLLRSLQISGLDQHDVELVHLQHSDGRLALQRGDVDAWAGIDPFMASAELREHARLLYRNINFCTFGTLNVREAFLAKYPAQVQRVIAGYEQARKWILAHPHETAELLAAEGKIDLDVATKQITERTVLDKGVGVPGEALHNALVAVVPILSREKLVGAGADPDKALGELVDPAAALAVIK
ncbi:MAG TPA: aliphatic sulfonate ABC transporter substrate-binding protein [Kofleriaceae bacterium]|jgi:sulfonate transport system substrate-binding protein|nr:aliphatic sulfonate ABC transporter substrate-binding protein [Kofleriaceae bacterium]